ncbi:MAG: hypothetical protein ACERKD_01075 [Prolixibacteraceae bacterium]
MKNIARIVMVIALAFSSCTSDVEVSRPEWLNEKVDELIVSEEMCDNTSVSVYEYNDTLYYNIYSDIWSCMFCYLYDADGTNVNWEAETFENFIQDKKLIDEFPACN